MLIAVVILILAGVVCFLGQCLLSFKTAKLLDAYIVHALDAIQPPTCGERRA